MNDALKLVPQKTWGLVKKPRNPDPKGFGSDPGPRDWPTGHTLSIHFLLASRHSVRSAGEASKRCIQTRAASRFVASSSSYDASWCLRALGMEDGGE